MTAETPSAAVPARPAVSLDGMAPSPGQRRPGGHAASVSRARARTGADPAVIDPVTRARTGGKQAQASQPALLCAATADHRDQHRGPLPLGDTRSRGRRGSV